MLNFILPSPLVYKLRDQDNKSSIDFTATTRSSESENKHYTSAKIHTPKI